MADRSTHMHKGELFWGLAEKWHSDKRTEFMCINLVMYAVGHFVEALLAEDNRHPACAARGVPHADRDALMRKYLVGTARLDAASADTYGDLVSRRDTFIAGGLPTREAVDDFMKRAQPLVRQLMELLVSERRAG